MPKRYWAYIHAWSEVPLATRYTLSIPLEYLNSGDIDGIIQYITTNSIDLGNERIYNYLELHHGFQYH